MYIYVRVIRIMYRQINHWFQGDKEAKLEMVILLLQNTKCTLTPCTDSLNVHTRSVVHFLSSHFRLRGTQNTVQFH